jgi:hypothetical protein
MSVMIDRVVTGAVICAGYGSPNRVTNGLTLQAAVVVGPTAAMVAGVTGCVEVAIAALMAAGTGAPAGSVAIGE